MSNPYLSALIISISIDASLGSIPLARLYALRALRNTAPLAYAFWRCLTRLATPWCGILGPPLLFRDLFSNFFKDLSPIFIIVETLSSSISLINDYSSIFAGTRISKSHSLVMNSSPLFLNILTGDMCITLVPSPPKVEFASSILPWKRCWPREVWLR